MAYPDGMAERSHIEAMIEHAAAQIDGLDKMLRGNGKEGVLTRLSHLERTDREMRKDFESLRDLVAEIKNSLDVLVHPGTELGVTKVRWEVVGTAIMAGSGALAFLMQIIGG